jgi:hypothetical protein
MPKQDITQQNKVVLILHIKHCINDLFAQLNRIDPLDQTVKYCSVFSDVPKRAIKMKSRIRKTTSPIVSGIFLACCLSMFTAQTNAQQPSANIDRIASFMAAYNEHDIDGMLLNMTDDVKWLGVANNQLVVETADKKQLQQAMQAHFEAQPNARSRIKDSVELGNTVAVVEEAFTERNQTSTSQCAMSIYQLADGLIASITYYAAAKC